MADITAIIAEAEKLRGKDEEALALEIGLREKHIESNPSGANNPALSVPYGTSMGLIDDVKAVGWRVLNRWNKEAYAVVCSSQKPEDQELRKKYSLR